MDKLTLFVRAAFLATKASPEGTVLCCGKETLPDTFGFLFYLIESQASSQHDPGSIITRTIHSGVNNYSKEITFFEGLLQRVNRNLEKGLASPTNLNAIIGLVDDNEISLSQVGHITGYIFRKNKISSMTERSGESRFFSDVTSGKIVAGDHIIFGNTDLFNRISLDRIRSLTQYNNAYEEVLVLAKALRKTKASFSNAIILEASEPKEEIDLDAPEIVFLDESKESLLHTSQKKLRPLADKLVGIFAVLREKSSAAGKKSSQAWQENYGPKTKELLQKSRKAIKESLAKPAKPNLEINTPMSGMTKKVLPRTRDYKHIDNPTLANKIIPFLVTAKSKTIPVFRLVFAEKNRKYLYLVLAVLLLVFGYGKIRSNNQQQAQKSKDIQTVNSYDEALATFNDSKNNVLLGKPGSLESIYDALSLAEKSSQAPENKDKAEKLIREIKTFADRQTKTTRFYTPTNFNFGENVQKFAVSGYTVFGFASDGKIYTADTRDKETKLLTAIPKTSGNIVDILYSDSAQKLLVYTDAKKIFSVDPDSRATSEIAVTEGSTGWEDANALAVYSSNIYLLSGNSGNLWKHTEKGTGFSLGTAYVSPKKVSLKDALSLTVDGNFFVLKSDGSVIHIIKGAPDNGFAIKGIPEPGAKITIPARIATTEDTNYLFILDKGDNRILKFDKNGQFINQYIFDGATVLDFVVNPKVQKIWALTAGKVMEGNL